MTPQKQEKLHLLHLLLPLAGQLVKYDQKAQGPDLTTVASLPCPRAAMPASDVMHFTNGGMVDVTLGRED